MQPHSVARIGYRSWMENRTDPRTVLWANVSALMRERYGKENLTQLATDAKVGPGTASRLKAMDTFAQLDTIEKIAAAFGLQPWQLLVPGLEPGNPPVLRDASPAERKLYRKFIAFQRAMQAEDAEESERHLGH